MTFVRYGQAALIAAIMAMTGNAVRAQQPAPASSFAPYKCCKDGKCCKEGDCCTNSKKCDASCTACKNGQCSKAGGCCSDSKKCDDKCTCCKDSKCACCKDGECCCNKNGKCSCGKDKTSATKIGCDCCPFLDILAKHTAIILVMPASMPLPACCMEAMGMIPHLPMPPMPPGPHVFLPPPMPPIPPFPPTPSMGLPGMPPMNVDWGFGYAPCPAHGNAVYAPPACCAPVNCTPASSSKFEISAPASSDQLEVSIGEETCIRAKKMTVKIGDKEITVSRFDDRVRVRGEDLKATALSVHSDHKGELILEGDVVLHCRKVGRGATYGDRIELDLSNSAVMIHKAAKASSPAVHIGVYESK
jgi:hypothetical protein